MIYCGGPSGILNYHAVQMPASEKPRVHCHFLFNLVSVDSSFVKELL